MGTLKGCKKLKKIIVIPREQPCYEEGFSFSELFKFFDKDVKK